MPFSTRYLLLTACAGLALAACGGSDNKSAANTPAAAGTPAATAAVTKASASAPAATQPAVTQKPATTSKVPADACALLTLDQVHQLAPTAGAGAVSPQQGAPGQSIAGCHWAWPEGNGSLDLTVSTLPAGAPEDVVKSSLQISAKKDGSELSGIGDFAIVTSVVKIAVEVQALVHGLLLTINLNVTGARDQQDKLIALAKIAAGGL